MGWPREISDDLHRFKGFVVISWVLARDGSMENLLVLLNPNSS